MTPLVRCLACGYRGTLAEVEQHVRKESHMGSSLGDRVRREISEILENF